jgi:hypothetical protein
MAFSESVKKEARERAHYCCALCHRPSVSLQVHHIHPEADGGPDTIENACPACPNCHADFGGNEEKRKMITQMRDWWWDHCTRMDEGPDVVALNRQIAELRIDQTRRFDEVQKLLVDRTNSMGAAILAAKSFEQLSAASGVSLPSGAYIVEPPPGAIDEDRELDRRILAAVAAGERDPRSLKGVKPQDVLSDRVRVLHERGFLIAHQSYHNGPATWIPVQVTVQGRAFLAEGPK